MSSKTAQQTWKITEMDASLTQNIHIFTWSATSLVATASLASVVTPNGTAAPVAPPPCEECSCRLQGRSSQPASLHASHASRLVQCERTAPRNYPPAKGHSHRSTIHQVNHQWRCGPKTQSQRLCRAHLQGLQNLPRRPCSEQCLKLVGSLLYVRKETQWSQFRSTRRCPHRTHPPWH